MKTRIKLLRKQFGLTQQAFATRLKISQNTIAQYESGRIVPSNPTITLICETFKVNEQWLRNGEGEMFNDVTPSKEIENFLNSLSVATDSDLKKRLILYLAQMKDSSWEKLEQVLNTLMEGKDILFPPDQKSEQ